jgi:flagellar hook-associated protein FlgK
MSSTFAGLSSVSSRYSIRASTGGATVFGSSWRNDPVIAGRARAEHGRNSSLQTSAATLSGVETLFDEPSDTGLSEQLNDFWSSWSGVANHPGDASARDVVLRKAAGLAGTLNASSASLGRLTEGLAGQLTYATRQINTAAGALAQLNGALKVAIASGGNTNTLADQRDVLLMTLAGLAGAHASTQADGSVTVTAGGTELVSGTTAKTLAGGSGSSLTVGGVVMTTSAGGVLHGAVESLGTILPGYAAKLDGVASALANSVNTLQRNGYDLSGTTGGDLFVGTSAATLKVRMTDRSKLAASGTPGGNLDNSNAARLAALGTSAAGADSQYGQLVSMLGADVQNATRQAAVQQSVTSSVDDLAESPSGVSVDEKTSSLLTCQRALQASSRVLSTVDDMLASISWVAAVQQKLSSGRQVTTPSDSPSGTAAALQLRAELKRMDQHQSSATDAMSWLSTVDSSLTSVINRVQQVRSLVLQRLNSGSGDANSNESLAQQVDQARSSLLSLANTGYLGRPVFGGTTAGPVAFDSAGRYAGDNGTVSRTVQANTTVDINSSGTATFGANSDNLFGLLADISAKLRSDPSALGGDLQRIDAAQRKLSGQQSLAGARSQRVRATQTAAVPNTIALKSQLSDLQHIDLANMVVDMTTAEAAYQSALATTAKIRQISLMDYLR